MLFLKIYFTKIIYNYKVLFLLEKVFGSCKLINPWIAKKSLAEQIDWYIKYLILKNLKHSYLIFSWWITNPYKVMSFILFLVINTPLRLIYTVFYVGYVVYWCYRLIRYATTTQPGDLSPCERDYYFRTWYLYFPYCVTVQRAHLKSYDTMYIILQRVLLRQSQISPYRLILKLPVLILWYLLRTITSIPRQVILDSYSWSQRFQTLNDYYCWQECIVHGVINVTLISELGPITNKRIYVTETTYWNFNPANIELINNLARLNPKVKHLESIANFPKCLEALQVHIKSTNSTIIGFTKIPHSLTTLSLGTKNSDSIVAVWGLSSTQHVPHIIKLATVPQPDWKYNSHFISQPQLIPESLLVHSSGVYTKGSFRASYSTDLGINTAVLSFMRPQWLCHDYNSITKTPNLFQLPSNLRGSLNNLDIAVNPLADDIILNTINSPEVVEFLLELGIADLEQFYTKTLVDHCPDLLRMYHSLHFNIVGDSIDAF